MARLRVKDDSMETGIIGGLSNFRFSSVKLDKLGAAEYTNVTIAIDVTGSLDGFEGELLESLKTSVRACKKSPRSENLLLRVIVFSSSRQDGIEELHGFKPLSEIDPGVDYQRFDIGGMTNLNDAAFSAVGGTCEYAKRLMDDDYLANGIVFVITDGYDNHSTTTPGMTKELSENAVRKEEIESIVTVLIGVNAAQYEAQLRQFQQEAGFDQYIDVKDITPQNLAKLADFVSQSVSSQSQALGTGGPSQNISASI